MLTAKYDTGYGSADRCDYPKLSHICCGVLESDRPLDTSLYPTS